MSNNIVDRLGIQSWCFRGMENNSEVIEALKECGVDRIELCGVHINFANNPEEVLKQYCDAGIKVSSYGVQIFDDDKESSRKALDFAKLADFDAIGGDFGPDGLETAEELCKEYGKKVAFHNHGRGHKINSMVHLDELFKNSSPNIGLCLDTAWMLDSGDDPLKAARKFKNRLYGVHIKDFVFDRAGRPEDVVVGTGNLDLQALADFLKEIDFDGYLTLEYEGDVDDPVPALKKCVEEIRKAFA